jgi:hypothetical protein
VGQRIDASQAPRVVQLPGRRELQQYSGNGFYFDPATGMHGLGGKLPVSINSAGLALANESHAFPDPPHPYSYRPSDPAPTDLAPVFNARRVRVPDRQPDRRQGADLAARGREPGGPGGGGRTRPDVWRRRVSPAPR